MTNPSQRQRASETASRVAYLDGLRGVAALCVAVLFHYQHFSGEFQPGGDPISAAPFFGNVILRAIYTHGFVAVDLFFMISGYIFSHVYAADIAAGRVSARTFLVRRFARLYPIHLLTLLVTAALVYAFFLRTGRFPVYKYNGPVEFTLNLLFMQQATFERGFNFNGPAWSLSVEALAYISFFMIARRRTPLRWAWLAIAIGLALMLSGVSRGWRPMLLSDNVACVLVGFFLGMLIHRLGEARPLMMAAMIGLIGGLPLLLNAGDPHAWTWITFGTALLALQRWPSLQYPLRSAPMVGLGDLSLAIYMVHFPVQVGILLLLNSLGRSAPLASFSFLVAYGLAVLATAWLAHRRFERPVQTLLRRRLAG